MLGQDSGGVLRFTCCQLNFLFQRELFDKGLNVHLQTTTVSALLICFSRVSRLHSWVPRPELSNRLYRQKRKKLSNGLKTRMQDDN